ncbi:PPC domain-containing protein [Okeania sp.]|uniref:PPC domain-containing protein n=1 Tax=Okeania sp. TaxID=3100323 RepID=UPI002B4ADC06|nr:PPC domain-containing protein [Okeania sp.]MEB3341346.1 PPC domain-containing protein [Okeania sp.]
MNFLESGSENNSLISIENEQSDLTQIPISGIQSDVENLSPLLEEPIESPLTTLVDETQSEEPDTTDDNADILTGLTKEEPSIVLRKAKSEDPGNNVKTAFDLGEVGDAPITYSDDIGTTSGGTTDKNDYYKFTLTGEENEVSILVDSLTDNANLELRDTDGKFVLSESTETGKKAENIEADLEKGTYYLRVYPQGNAKTDYDLTISAEEILEDLDPEPSGATDLGELGKKEQSIYGEIGFREKGIRDISDFYQFTLTEELNHVNVVLDSLTANANITLFDEDGETIINQSREKGKKKEEIDQVLEAGTYYLQVEPQGTAKTEYRLSVDSDRIYDPDGTIDLAQKIEVGEEPENFTDKIGFQEYGQRDQRDYYQFTLENDKEVNITLDGLNQNADLELQDYLGNLLFSSSQKSKALDEITSILEPGDYHILVKPFGSARTKYNLSINATDPKDLDGQVPGQDLGKLGEDEIKKTDNIGFTKGGFIDANDYSKFELTEETDLTIQLDGLSQNADLELYDSDGTTLLYESSNKGKVAEEINQVLEPGVYYTRVKKVGSNKTKYSLSLSGIPTDDGDDNPPGNDLEVVLGEDPVTISDQVGFTIGSVKDFQDYYNFTLTKESEVNITLDGLTGNGKLELLAEDNTSLLGTSDNSKQKSETIDEILEPGTYYVRVSPGGNGAGKTKYNLEISADENKDDYPTPATAKELGNLNQKFTIDENNDVGFTKGTIRDLVDYFSFELTESAEVNLTLDKLNRNANLELLDGDGDTILDQSENLGKTQESITKELNPGTYYARVIPVGKAKTEYELSLQTDRVPTVVKPIEDIEVNEDAANEEIDLSKYFTDADSELIYKVTKNTNTDLVNPSINGDILTLDFLDDKFGTTNIRVKATAANDGKFVTDTFAVNVASVEDPLVISNPIGNKNVYEDAPNQTIDLFSVFTDADPDSIITFATPINDNPDLVNATIKGNNLILDYLDNQHGKAEISVSAESNGETKTDTFTVKVVSVDDPPIRLNPILDINVDEDAPNQTIDLSSVFTDIDSTLTFIPTNNNPGLVSATIEENNLTLDFLDNKFGTAKISVVAKSKGKTVTDTFTVNVAPIDDLAFKRGEIPDVNVDEDAPNQIIDLSSVFIDIDNPFTFIQTNNNPGLVSETIEGNNLTLDFLDNQFGKAEIMVVAESNGLFLSDTFAINVASVEDILVPNPIDDINVYKNSPNQKIDLYSLFTDPDPDSIITFLAPTNTNPGLLSATIKGNNLILDYLENQLGTAQITVSAVSNGQTVTNTFTVNVAQCG